MSAEQAFTILQDRPRTITPVLELAPTQNLPAVVPVAVPPVAAKDLFVLMERLDYGMDQALSVRGKGTGQTAPGKMRDTQVAWGWGYALAGASAFAYYCGISDPTPFFAGAAASGITLFGTYWGAHWVDGKLRKQPAPVTLAEPFLDAFKNGGNATQALVTKRAEHWANQLNTLEVGGQDLRQQLREIGNVKVETDYATTRRLEALDSIIKRLPKTKKDIVYGDAIASQLELLDSEDRPQIAALLLERLYDGEKLIGRQYSAPDCERLYAALIKTQPSRIATSDSLQKLVAPRT